MMGRLSTLPPTRQERCWPTWPSSRTVPTVLDCLVGLASLWAQEGKTTRALQMLVFALHQSAITKDRKERAMALSTELAAGLSPDVVAEVKARGQAHEPDELVAEILRDEEVSAPSSSAPSTRSTS